LKRGLYVHIPFCNKKCNYCNFISTANNTPEIREQFFIALEKEINHAETLYGKLSFDTLYIGGGTPSILIAEEMARLFTLLRSHFDFEPECETTCEINPGSDIDENKLKTYRDLGINRISLGGQAFQDFLLKDMGRTHNANDTFETVHLLKRAGFDNISLDLIIRLPGQLLEHIEESLKYAISLHMAQVTVYDLEVHEKTGYGARQKRGELKLPDQDQHEEMFRLVENYLTSAGYKHYELLSFAKPGFESKHNLIYWHNQEYLGLGPGAFSYMNGVRYQFAGDVNSYFKKCAENVWTRDVEDILTDEEKERESLLTGLRLDEGVDLNQFNLIRKSIENKLDDLIGNGLIERRGTRIALTLRGRFLAESVFAEFAVKES
jgi:oxygen-independent coproporphyrinogen-3 oxidase